MMAPFVRLPKGLPVPMYSRYFYHVLQLRKRLWARPLLYCVLAVFAAFLARLADLWIAPDLLPEISRDTVETLLSIISSSMLAVATFAVGSMVSSYASAGQSATPRAFALVLEDDVSKNALSSFIGAFIFSIVAIVALKTGLYGPSGVFGLFALTLAIFSWVVLTFVRWVDNIARLGRLGSTIDRAEKAARASIQARLARPFLGGVEQTEINALTGTAIHGAEIGYVQHVDMEALQSLAAAQDCRLMVVASPGRFVAPGRPLVITDRDGPCPQDLQDRIAAAFVIGNNRTFDSDPRFGLIVLSEISARALSPGVNDPGTAIVTIGRFIKLLSLWSQEAPERPPDPACDRIIVPAVTLAELFDDAFTAIERDGAGTVEVGIRLQKAFASLASLPDPRMRDEARRHSALALKRARAALTLPEDIDMLEAAAEPMR